MSADPRTVDWADVIAPTPPPLDVNAPPPLDQYCDLVLKGGVIDGLVYPGVLVELARQFRFKGIAGTSVGAIAAALAAACEYARRFGSNDGFNEVLRKMPDELSAAATPEKAGTVLRSLFQTKPEQSRIFEILLALFSVPKSAMWAKAREVIWAQYAWIFWQGLVLGIVTIKGLELFIALPFGAVFDCLNTLCLPNRTAEFTHWGSVAWGVLKASPISILLIGLVAGLLWVVLTIFRELRAVTQLPGFGFCSGMSVDGGKTPALTEWLHRGIQGAAKLPLGRPLTFNDLWMAPGGPASAQTQMQTQMQTVPRSIDLRMISTSLSHGRPYELPLDPSVRLFFKLSELAPYFPDSVMAHLAKNAPCYSATKEAHEKLYARDKEVRDGRVNEDHLFSPDPQDIVSDDFRELPFGELPILVAARLSLNFPILFQSIPLWSIDHEAGSSATPHRLRSPRFRKNWFSDGGITANFPIHFFDNAVPKWPTFGVYIAEKNRRVPATTPTTYLPEFHTSGRNERWNEIDGDDEVSNPPKLNTTGFFDFLLSIFGSTKDWADNANLRMPGTRDRVVTIYKNNPLIGGLNLNLAPNAVRNLGYITGREAGEKLVHKFATNPARINPVLQGTPGWLDHRWVRLNAYIGALKAQLAGFDAGIKGSTRVASAEQQISQATQVPPLHFDRFIEPTLSTAQAQALKTVVADIQRLEAQLNADTLVQPYQPAPKPRLKLAPQF